MDTVILAGGRGSRLSQIVPEFYKPLVKVNGKALVAQAAEHALATTDGNIVVVAAPQNAQALDAALPSDRRIQIVVQRSPNGPGSALLLGLEAVRSEFAMVLLADNLMTRGDVTSVANIGQYRDACAVAVRDVDAEEAMRFTRVLPDGTTREAEPLREDELQNGKICVWVGPLVVDTRKGIDVLSAAGEAGGEYKIGPWIPAIAPNFGVVSVSSCWDVGVPDAFDQVGATL